MFRVLMAVVLLSIQPFAHLSATQPAAASAVTTATATPTMASVYLHWVRVDPQQPRTLYLGGALGCDQCAPSLVLRSTDAGATWADFGDGLGLHDAPLGVNESCQIRTPPLVLGPQGHLYAEVDQDCGSPHVGTITSLAVSLDHGGQWLHTQGSYDGPETGSINYGDPIVSPVAPARVYAMRDDVVLRSDDAGRHFKAGGRLAQYPVDLVASATKAATVYANVWTFLDPDTYSIAISALRSDDAGVTWTQVITPTATPPLQGFRVGVDSHEPGLLVGYSTGVITGTGYMLGPLPALTDTRYLSADEGRTWRRATCPGDVQGTCPRFTLDNLFGAGASYALGADGLHAFNGGGPGTPRLAISDTLPVKPAAIIDLGGGASYGDPIYLLGQGMSGQVHNLLYRSTDGGKSWQRLQAGILPTAEPPSSAPGALLVRATHHSVASAFVRTYRKLGVDILGYPLTEAFLEGGYPTQVFQRLELQLIGGKVTIGHLGRIIFDLTNDQTQFGIFGIDHASGDPSVAPIPMPDDIARYYRDHGGRAIFGRPITDVFTASNGDGSTRTYAMQLFDNARIERHPESMSARYTLQLGLIGRDSLSIWGWM